MRANCKKVGHSKKSEFDIKPPDKKEGNEFRDEYNGSLPLRDSWSFDSRSP